MVTAKICLSVKDIHREKTCSYETPVCKEQYEYGHLGCWYCSVQCWSFMQCCPGNFLMQSLHKLCNVDAVKPSQFSEN